MPSQVDILVSLPGPAEGLLPAIRALRRKTAGRTFGLEKDTLYPGIGGSSAVFSRALPEAVDLATALGEPDDLGDLLRENPPDLLLVGAVDDLANRLRHPEKDAIRIARELGIPTVQFVDNWSAWPRFEPGPDHLLVIDALSERLARTLCPSSKSCTVCGHPGLGHLYQTLSVDRRGPPWRVGYFTQLNLDTRQALGWLRQALRPDEELWIKRHPRDNRPYDGLLEGFRCPATLVDAPPETLYADIGCTVIHTSVVGLKAVLLGIPTINLAPRELAPEIYDLLGGYPLALAGFSREVNSAAELRVALDEARPGDPQSLSDHLHLIDAAERLVRRIDELLR